MIAEAVYIVATLTSLVCAWLLLRAHRRSGLRVLLWSGLAFVGLSLNNVLYYADVFVFPTTDLSAWRLLPAIVGLSLLCYGLIWEAN